MAGRRSRHPLSYAHARGMRWPMILYLAVWLELACPSFLGLTVIPKSLQPLVCRQEIRLEVLDPAKLEAFLREKGPNGATLYRWERGKLTKPEVSWSPKVAPSPMPSSSSFFKRLW